MDDDEDAAGAALYGDEERDDDGEGDGEDEDVGILPPPGPACREGGHHCPALGSSRSLGAADADTLSGTAPRVNCLASAAPNPPVDPPRLRGTPRKVARLPRRPSPSSCDADDPRDPPPTPTPAARRPRHAVAPTAQPLWRWVRPPPTVDPDDTPRCSATLVIADASIVAVLRGGVVFHDDTKCSPTPPSSVGDVFCPHSPGGVEETRNGCFFLYQRLPA